MDPSTIPVIPSPFEIKRPVLDDVPQLTGLNDIFAKIISYVLALGAIVLFVMLIIGGFKFITSGGDAKITQEAKKTITAAIGGIALLALSFLILKLIEQFTGVTLTTFSIVGQ